MRGARATARPSSDDRRAAMLAIARAAFLREGYAAASVAEIAAKIGGSKATLYSYFPSKKDLFVAVIEDEVRRMFVPLFDMDETQEAPFVRSSRDSAGASSTCCWPRVRSGFFYRLVVAESARFPEVGQAAYQFGIHHRPRSSGRVFRRGDGAGRTAAGGGVGRGDAIPGFVLRRAAPEAAVRRRRRRRPRRRREAGKERRDDLSGRLRPPSEVSRAARA